MSDPKDPDTGSVMKEDAAPKKTPVTKTSTAKKTSPKAKSSPAAKSRATSAGKAAGQEAAAAKEDAAPAKTPEKTVEAAASGSGSAATQKTPAPKTAQKRAAASKKTADAASGETPSEKTEETGTADKKPASAASAKRPSARAAAGRKTAGQAPATPATGDGAEGSGREEKAAAKSAAPKAAGTKKASAAKTATAAKSAATAAKSPAKAAASKKADEPKTEEAAATAAPGKTEVAPGKERPAPKAASKSKTPGGRQAAEKKTGDAAPFAAPENAPGQSAPAAAPVSGASDGDEAQASFAPFDDSFGDSGPEDFFAAEDGGSGEEPSGSVTPGEGAGVEERKRRSRSRRGRGRKKNAAAVENGETASGMNGSAEAGAVAEGAVDEEADAGDEGASARASRRKMFVSVLPEEQVEVVIAEEGQVQEYYVEMLHQAKTKGNIYKGTVHNVDPNLQAAFISYGAVKNGFLQIDEVHPEYYVTPHEASKGRKYPPIQKVLKAGQELLIQVVKEPAGTKGAFVTTYLSMPGRFLVLTPGREQIGVSRKVENETERARLREMLEGLSPGPGLGVIVRTVSMGASKTNLQRDLQYLKRTWKEVRTRGTTEQAPCLVYQEMDLTSRAVRDYLNESIGEIWIDDAKTAAAVTEVAEALFPRKKNLVRVHDDASASLFERFNLQRQLDQIHSREVVLPSGGRLVIDPTEALTAIDINSGRSSGKNNFEDMAYRTNMEAARMIPLQLRLRDIGGQVVADFIEMRDKSHWREVEKTLRAGMKVDRARYDVGKIGPFGMLEIVRQRLGSSAISVSTEPCPCCKGTGIRRNMEWQSQHALRDILRAMRQAQSKGEESVQYQAEQALAVHLLNNKKQRLVEMEQQYGVLLEIQLRQPEYS